MTNLPPGPHGQGRSTVTWANMLMVSKACKHPEAAWEFVRFVAGIEGSLLRLKHLGQNSPRKDFYERAEWKAMVQQKSYLGMVQEICVSGAKRPSFESKAAESAFGPYFESLLISGTAEDVPGVMHAAAEHITRIYRRAREFFVEEPGAALRQKDPADAGTRNGGRGVEAWQVPADRSRG